MGVPTDMQLVRKLTEADLNDVQKDMRSKTFWRALSPAAILKLMVRAFALLMGLASIAAISIVGALSFVFYGAAKLLGKFVPCATRINFCPAPTTVSSTGSATRSYETPETLPPYGS